MRTGKVPFYRWVLAHTHVSGCRTSDIRWHTPHGSPLRKGGRARSRYIVPICRGPVYFGPAHSKWAAFPAMLTALPHSTAPGALLSSTPLRRGRFREQQSIANSGHAPPV